MWNKSFNNLIFWGSDDNDLEENSGHEDTSVDDISVAGDDEGSSSKVSVVDKAKKTGDDETEEDEKYSMDITGK